MPTQDALHFAVLAVDIALFVYRDGALHVLTIPVHLPPYFLDARGLPGGLIRSDETAEQAIERILLLKTGISRTKDLWIEQLATFSAVDRDPRGRVVSLAYIAVLPPDAESELVLAHGSTWVKAGSSTGLAYDHDEILATGVKRLQNKLVYTPIVASFLKKEFALADVQACYEQLLGRPFDRRNFRKRFQKLDIIEKTGSLTRGQHRPATLYRFRQNLPESVSMIPE